MKNFISVFIKEMASNIWGSYMTMDRVCCDCIPIDMLHCPLLPRLGGQCVWCCWMATLLHGVECMPCTEGKSGIFEKLKEVMNKNWKKEMADKSVDKCWTISFCVYSYIIYLLIDLFLCLCIYMFVLLNNIWFVLSRLCVTVLLALNLNSLTSLRVNSTIAGHWLTAD